MKVTKMNIALFILLLAVFAVIGTQYQAAFGTNTGIFEVDQTIYEVTIPTTITITGKAWIEPVGYYEIDGYTPIYGRLNKLDSVTITSLGYWAFNAKIPVTQYGTYTIYLSRGTGDSYIGNEKSIIVRAKTVTTPPTTNTCAGVTCGNYCSGTTLYKSGVCSNGQCNYQTVINSVECGYVPPVTVGSLYVDAVPDGILTLDGTIRGETPLTISSLSIGSHAVSIQKEGYKEFTATVNVNAGANAVVYTLVADDVPSTASSSDTMTTIMLIMILFVVLLGIVYWQVKR